MEVKQYIKHSFNRSKAAIKASYKPESMSNGNAEATVDTSSQTTSATPKSYKLFSQRKLHPIASRQLVF